MEVNIKEMKELAYEFVKKGKPLFIHGAPGIGKSDAIKQVAMKIAKEKDKKYYEGIAEQGVKDGNFCLLDVRVTQLEPADIRGIPFPQKDVTKWLKPDWLPKGGEGILFFDELNLAPPSIQAACFKEDAIVSGEEQKKIKDLKIGDKVVDMNGDLQNVTELKNRNYDGTMYEIKGRHFLPIEATNEHPFYVIEGYRKGNKKHKVKRKVGKAKWKNAEKLKAGDYIGIPKLKPNTKIRNLEISKSGDVSLKIQLTDEFAKFLGYYVGDGYYSNSRVGICLNKTEKKYKKEVTKLIEKVFGKRVSYKKGKNVVDVGFNNKEIGLFLKKLCGKNTYNKKIPKEILYHEDRELLRNFLKGYHNADGHIYNSTAGKSFIGYTTVSKGLALQVQKAYTKFGLLVAINVQEEDEKEIRGKKIKCRESYRIQSSQNEIFDALNIKRKNPARKITKHFFEEDEKLWARIDKIKTEHFKGKVYNCEVENTHSYLANNYIVHNCYELILNRRIGNYELPKGWTVIAAGNRAIDKANIFSMAAPLKNRFAHYTLLPPSDEMWRDWAIENGIKTDIIAFMAFKPSLLYKFDPSVKDDAFPTHRTWAMASEMTEGIKKEDTIFKLTAGCVGEGAALEYMGFVKLKKKINVEDIINNPKKVKKIKDIGLKHSLVSGLAEKYKSDKKKLNKILGVVEQLDAEFGVFLLRMLQGINPADFDIKLMNCKKWERISERFRKYIL